MAGAIIWYCVCFGCAILFYGIGAYAQRLEKPMWFWSGTEVDPAAITDIKQYNKANSTMWKLYSLWYFAAGAAKLWDDTLALVLLLLGCVAGIPQLICTYKAIERKYKAK